jgi:8-oxo-dGTP pyrophosphatase MutT (NUDIX family)
MAGDADSHLPFVILAEGRFGPSQLRDGRLLYDGPSLRYVEHRVDPDPPRFHLTVGPTSYRDFVGTNLFNRHRLDEFGWHRFANPVGTTATLVSADGLICYGRRSERVAYHASHVHTFGGALEGQDLSPEGQVDPFASLLRELREELSLRPDDLRDLICAGMIRDKEIHQPELLFEARLTLTADALRERWRSAESRGEHVEIVTLPDQPEAIVPFIKGCGPIAPVAVGALMLHGRACWGREWFDGARLA